MVNLNERTQPIKSAINIVVKRLIRLQRCCGDKRGELWMICEDTNHGDRKLKAKGFQEHKPFEGIAFKERSDSFAEMRR